MVVFQESQGSDVQENEDGHKCIAKTTTAVELSGGYDPHAKLYPTVRNKPRSNAKNMGGKHVRYKRGKKRGGFFFG